MIESLQLLFGIYILCIVLSTATLMTALFFVIPLQLKKAGVQNGLSSLRKKQLTKGILSVLISMITIFILGSRFFLEGEIILYFNTALVLLFNLFWFVIIIIESSIYHTQFTEDQIELHKKIHKEEVKLEKVEASRVKRNSTRRKATSDRKKLDAKAKKA